MRSSGADSIPDDRPQLDCRRFPRRPPFEQSERPRRESVYLERRTSEGKTKREAMRALKRHLSRSLYKRLITIPLTS